MKILSRILALVLINGYIVYFIGKYLPSLLTIKPSPEAFTPELVLIVGFVFWLVNDVAKAIVRFFSLPLIWLTLWLISLIINVLAIYGFVYVVNSLKLWVEILVPSLFAAFALSLLVSIINLFFKKI